MTRVAIIILDPIPVSDLVKLADEAPKVLGRGELVFDQALAHRFGARFAIRATDWKCADDDNGGGAR